MKAKRYRVGEERLTVKELIGRLAIARDYSEAYLRCYTEEQAAHKATKESLSHRLDTANVAMVEARCKAVYAMAEAIRMIVGKEVM